MLLVDGRFELEALIARGGMGRLFSAIDQRTGSRVAVKQLTLDGLEARQRFEREAVMLSLVRHPNVVGHVAHGRHGEQFYLAMELLRGETVGARIAREGLTVGEAVAVASQVVSALKELQRIGLVHRDIKPQNLMVPHDAVAPLKLVDFGLARDTEGVGVLTSTGMTVGSPGYMSPEQARGERNITSAADVYALGCVLYLALTGRTPFPGNTALAVHAKILTYSPPSPASLNPACPIALSYLATQMLELEPADRPDLDTLAIVLSGFSHIGATPRQRQWSAQERLDRAPPPTAELAPRAESFAIALARPNDDDGEKTREVPTEALAPLKVLEQRYGARLGVTRGGTCVLTSRPEARPRDRALLGAQLSLAARAQFPDWAVALALGPVDDDVVVDRALALLNAELLGWLMLGPSVGVRIDEDTANRLVEEAEVRTERSSRRLVTLRVDPLTLS